MEPRTPIWLGAMNFGKRTPEAEARRIVERAVALGVTRIDTANAYGDGESERIVGRLLGELGERGAAMRVATKVGFLRLGGRPEGLSRARVVAAAQESLDRLRRPAIDVYYLHVPDHETPIDETLDGFAELHGQGLIRGVGVSNYASWQILEIEQKLAARGLPPIAENQVLYNPLIREIEIEHLRFVRAHRVPTIVYNPLAGGLLTPRYADDAAPPTKGRLVDNAMYQRRYYSPRMRALAAEVRAIAARHGLGVLELAYRFPLSRPELSGVLVGPGDLGQLEDAARALAGGALPPEIVKELDDMTRAHLGTDTHYVR